MNQPETKKCVKCQQTKPIDEFYQNPKGDGRRIGRCDKCRSDAARVNHKIRSADPTYAAQARESRKVWRARNRERAKKARHENYVKNRERDLAKNKIWQQENKERVAVAKRAYESTHREIYRASMQRWRKSEKGKSYHRNRIKTNPTYHIKCRLRCRLKDALRAGKLSKSLKTAELLGCTPEHLKTHLESMFYDGMTWDNMGYGPDKWQIDHVRPVGLFDLTDPEQQKACFHWTNLQPLWGKDHLVKTKADLRQIKAIK
ncbi:MAG: hypothetical protein WCV82_04450 [Candidatus Paceibacterota bacterium]|jgi:hypothetical protein